MQPKPKKSLGQNFLVSQGVRCKIVNSCGFKAADIVVEIGPGRGELTAMILPLVGRLYAVELDSALSCRLRQMFAGADNLEVINRDFLKLGLSNYAAGGQKLRVIGNIPYYISTPILESLVGSKDVIRDVFLTVQKEFAERIIAKTKTGAFGALSCFIQYNFNVKKLFDIKSGSFFPRPKVDSSFLHLVPRACELAGDRMGQERLFRLIRSAFCQRRKTLRNSLTGIVDKHSLDRFFSSRRLNRNARPQDISLEDFIYLASA